MRDVSVDEVFTWKEDFDTRAQEAFGCGTRSRPDVDVSPSTYADLKQRCDRIEREIDPFFERHWALLSDAAPMKGIVIHMVRTGEVPDGARRCSTRVPVHKEEQ